MVAPPWSSSRLSCGEHLPLRCDGNTGNSFPTTQGKDPSSRARRRKRGSSGCGQDSRASSRVETGMSRIFLNCSKCVKDPLEVPELRCDKIRDSSAEMGLISPGGENLLDFLELRQVLSTYDGYLRDPLWWPQERPVPMELLGGLSVFLSRRCWGLRPCVESVPEPEDSSPVLTWILGYFWSLPGESVLVASVACLCAFLPSFSSSVTLPFTGIQGSVAFSVGFPTRLSH